MHRQADDGGGKAAFTDGSGDGEAVHAGHVDVEDGHLRMEPFDGRERRSTVAGVAHDRESGFPLEEPSVDPAGRPDGRPR